MEQKGNNKAATIFSVIGIVLLVGFVIFMCIKGLSKDKGDNTEDIYTNLRPDVTTVTETPVPTQPAQEESTTDITEFLNSLTTDLTTYLQCTNPNIVSFDTRGLTLDKLGSMRTVLGQSTVETWSFWQADYELTTAAVEGEYVINLNLNTKTGSKKLYVYVWAENNHGYYVTSVSFEIGDF